jgi:hypothetical protein
MALSEVYVSVPMPSDLAGQLRVIADRDYSSLAATARRMIARGVVQELQAWNVSVQHAANAVEREG